MPSGNRSDHSNPLAHRGGLTAIESLLSIAIVSIAGSALLTSLGTAAQSSREIALSTVARGLAEELLEEAIARPVPSGTAPSTPPGPRSGYVFVDQYDAYTESPPKDRSDRTLGTEGTLEGIPAPRPAGMQADLALLAGFRRSVTVEKVTPSDAIWTVTAASTPFRRVTVRVTYSDSATRTLADLSRIVCYVGPTP